MLGEASEREVDGTAGRAGVADVAREGGQQRAPIGQRNKWPSATGSMMVVTPHFWAGVGEIEIGLGVGVKNGAARV